MDTIVFIASAVILIAAVLWKLRAEEQATTSDVVFDTRVLIAAIGAAGPAKGDAETYSRFYKHVDRRDFDDLDELLGDLSSAAHEVVHLLTREPLGTADAQRLLQACGSTEVRLVSFAGHGGNDLVDLVPEDLNCLVVVDRQGELWDAFLADFLYRAAVNGRQMAEAFAETVPDADEDGLPRHELRRSLGFLGRLLFADKPMTQRVIKLIPRDWTVMALFVRSEQGVTLLP